jgi:hypothetical protein
VDAYAPYAVDGLSEALGFRGNRVALLALLGGVAGGAAIYALMWYSAVVDYPINSGGRPLDSWPVFIIPTFEVTVLCAALAAFVGMLVLNGLPTLHHPIFNAPDFDLASRNRFFLSVRATDAAFDANGNAYVAHFQTGALYKFGPDGGSATTPPTPSRDPPPSSSWRGIRTTATGASGGRSSTGGSARWHRDPAGCRRPKSTAPRGACTRPWASPRSATDRTHPTGDRGSSCSSRRSLARPRTRAALSRADARDPPRRPPRRSVVRFPPPP